MKSIKCSKRSIFIMSKGVNIQKIRANLFGVTLCTGIYIGYNAVLTISFI